LLIIGIALVVRGYDLMETFGSKFGRRVVVRRVSISAGKIATGA
jgi:hypothetical protein